MGNRIHSIGTCALLTLLACALPAYGQVQDLKFGLFIHWGLYAIPAGEWKGRIIPGPGESIMRNAQIPIKDYEQLAAQFNPTQFDAEAWVTLAEAAGMKYIVFTAKDHDGFAMYRSAVSKYNVYDATPFHRDPLKELAAACAKHNIKLGVYYSQSQDWHEQGKSELQVKELLTGYGPIAVIRFDAPPPQRLIDIVHASQPATLIDESQAETINDTWGYRKDDNHWKSPDELIFHLVDIVSKGGNYLLNVGPTADGIVPRPSLVTLESMGAWLGRNGDAIYGAGPSPFGEEFAASKWRCTTKPGKLFITVFQWPDGPLELNKVADKITRAYLLADASRAPLQATQTGARVTVALPKDPPFEGSLPDRIRPNLAITAARAHVRSVVVLETVGK